MNIIEESNKYVLNTYSRFPLAFKKGKGLYLYTVDNRKFLDMATGVAVSCLGHSHPAVVKAIKCQADKLLHMSNLYYTIPYTLLAKKIVEKSIFNKVFFCNSGGEANEAALKLARKHGKKAGGNKKFEIITLKGSFHGRTIATLSATGQEKIQKGFEPLLQGFKFAELNNINSLKKLINKSTAALMIEPVQGESGIRPVNKDFMTAAREFTLKVDALLIFDEVQTGIGRTGKLFGYEHFLPVEPDAITLAKGLGAGMPIGALLVKEKHSSLLGPGEHASTFGGNPVCCSASLAVFETIEKEKLLDNAVKIGAYFKEKLNKLKEKYSLIKEVRGLGLHIGVEINMDPIQFINKMMDNNIIAVKAGDNVVRFLPPLIVEKKHIDIVIMTLDKIFKELKA